jgi:hypothetical protein
VGRIGRAGECSKFPPCTLSFLAGASVVGTDTVSVPRFAAGRDGRVFGAALSSAEAEAVFGRSAPTSTGAEPDDAAAPDDVDVNGKRFGGRVGGTAAAGSGPAGSGSMSFTMGTPPLMAGSVWSCSKQHWNSGSRLNSDCSCWFAASSSSSWFRRSPSCWVKLLTFESDFSMKYHTGRPCTTSEGLVLITSNASSAPKSTWRRPLVNQWPSDFAASARPRTRVFSTKPAPPPGSRSHENSTRRFATCSRPATSHASVRDAGQVVFRNCLCRRIQHACISRWLNSDCCSSVTSEPWSRSRCSFAYRQR